MKNRNNTQINASQNSSLMWLKRDGYSKKNDTTLTGSGHENLVWVKVPGYKQSITKSARYTTAFEQIQLQRARFEFYSCTMIIALVSSLLLLSFLNH